MLILVSPRTFILSLIIVCWLIPTYLKFNVLSFKFNIEYSVSVRFEEKMARILLSRLKSRHHSLYLFDTKIFVGSYINVMTFRRSALVLFRKYKVFN